MTIRHRPILLVGIVFSLVSLLSSFSSVSANSPYQTDGYEVHLPIVYGLPIPPATESRYITKTDYSTMYDYGCKLGYAMLKSPYSISVLFFGQPWYDAVSQKYGTLLLDDNLTFVDTSAIVDAAKAWINGYWQCTPVNGPHVLLAIGTNNFGPRTQITYDHGKAWAILVNDIMDYITFNGYDTQISIAGANNIELDWNKSDVTKDWVNGYTSSYQRTLYHVGDCSGCPYASHPDWLPNNGWTYEDIWYVSWRAAPSVPLPEIYSTSGISAAQWQLLALWAYDTHNSNMTFAGSLTQWQACIDRNAPCTGTNNKPLDGWLQFYRELSKDSKTAQYLNWSTDLRWNY